MAISVRVAVITGGASGIGLAVARALASRSGWKLFLFDKEEERGNAAAKEISGATFCQVDVTDYDGPAKAFDTSFQAHGRLDFVFANAGIAMTAADTARMETSGICDGPPPAPDTSMIDINLQGVINTSILALHYLSKPGQGGDLIITASSAGFYASAVSPAYSASKHGVMGWTRSIAPPAWKEHKIRVNAICPGIARTNILPEAVFQMFPDTLLTPVSKVVDVVLLLLDSRESIEGHLRYGQTVEICGPNHYFRQQIEYCDATMMAVMGAGAPAE